MRRSGSGSGFVHDEKGNLLGFFLKPDFCAEHEGGLSHLRQIFGVNTSEDDQCGVEARRIRYVKDGDNLHYFSQAKKALLTGQAFYKPTPLQQQIKEAAREFSWELEECGFGSQWSDRGFSVCVTGAENVDNLEKIYQAFLEKDVLIMYGGGNRVFSGGGLVVGIISALPEDIVTHIYKTDKDARELKLAAQKTGVYDLIGHEHYFALSPRWANEDVDSLYPVIFWLNPTDQETNAYGYFTVEQLIDWITGKAPDGPIANRGSLYRQQKRAERVAAGDVKELFGDEVCCPQCVRIINVVRSGHLGKSCSVCGKKLIRPEPVSR